jgi:hypothetical protein
VDNKNRQDESCKHPHMCRLKQEGMMEEIDRHSARPRMVCSKCGAKADDAAYLCNPRPL